MALPKMKHWHVTIPVKQWNKLCKRARANDRKKIEQLREDLKLVENLYEPERKGEPAKPTDPDATTGEAGAANIPF